MELEERIQTPLGVTLALRTVGEGPPVLFIPSLGRNVADFDDLAARTARAGYLALLPQPRGIGGSAGPAPTDLFALARDVVAVIEHASAGPAHLVGHAFGNRVARAAAALRPDLAASIVLLAGGGASPPTPEVRDAVRGATRQGLKPDVQRLEDLVLAFFAAGHDPRVWLGGWFPAAAEAQVAAGTATDTARWWAAGPEAPVLLVQALEDPVAPPGNAEALSRAIGERLRLVRLAHASHAILPEQPRAVAATLIAWFRGERNAATLQTLMDAETLTPG